MKSTILKIGGCNIQRINIIKLKNNHCQLRREIEVFALKQLNYYKSLLYSETVKRVKWQQHTKSQKMKTIMIQFRSYPLLVKSNIKLP